MRLTSQGVGRDVLAISLLLALCFIHSQAIYQAKSYGFLTAFNRSQPLVLLRTAIGLQMLTGNRSCYNNQTSVYYSSESAIKYVSYSSAENYLAIVNAEDQICFRNFFKSDWNNGMKRDMRRECKSQNSKGLRHYGLSINMHVMFAIASNADLFVVSMEEPMCASSIAPGPANAKILHVTNFARSSDVILVGTDDNHVHVFTPDGNKKNSLNTLESNDTLKAIGSHEDEWRNFFLAVDRGQTAVLLRYNNSISSVGQVIFKEANRRVISLSTSGGLLALLLQDTQNPHSYWLHLQSSVAEKDHETTVYQCEAGPDLIEAILVNRREQRVTNFCDENMIVCSILGQGKMCDYTKIFSFDPQLRLNETKIESELQHKTTLTLALATICLLVLGLFQIVNNARI